MSQLQVEIFSRCVLLIIPPFPISTNDVDMSGLRCLDTVRGSRHVAQLQVTLHFYTSHFYTLDSDFTPWIVIYSDIPVIGDRKL